MKKNILIALIFAALTLSGCGEENEVSRPSGNDSSEPAVTTESTADDVSSDSVPDDTDSTEDSTESSGKGRPMAVPDWHPIQDSTSPDTIVLVRRYSNWAWGYQDNGSFITLDGRVYTFDFGDNDGSYDKDPPEDFVGALEKIRDNSEPEASVDGDIIAQCLAYTGELDPEKEYEKEYTACDAGQCSVYCVVEHEMIELSTYGDCTGERRDPAAAAILDLLDESEIMNSGRDNPFKPSAADNVSQFFRDLF